MGSVSSWGRGALVCALALAGCAGEGEENQAGGADAAVSGFQDGGPERDAQMDLGQPGDAAPDALPPDGGPALECAEGTERPCPDEACPQGTQRCVDLRWTACVGPAEICNGLDDDCDGATDEDWPALGTDCAVSMGACEGRGLFVCNPDPTQGEAVVCGAAAAAEPVPEACNGIDDDCDGIEDATAGAPVTQDCYEGPEGTLGVGACAAGRQACADGVFGGECAGQVLPQDEICNGLDDDCDGQTDEGIADEVCYTGPAGTVNVGVCRAGVRVCEDGALTACRREVLPQVEICDSLDNDCDGEVDDAEGAACACRPGEVRACYTGPEGTAGTGLCREGRQTCNEDGRTFGPCEGQQVPVAEICDGLDNDCDGRTDDGIEGVGAECADGVGACRARGVTFCNSETGAVECGARPGAPRAEVCNGEDDDCDGVVDDGLGVGDPCQVGVGTCRAHGRHVCDGGGGVTCDAMPGRPGAELCDGLDNDCDGAVDDGIGLGDACTAGVGACASDGRRVCAEDGTVACDARPGEPAAETCDGADDDCDGRTDEDNPGGGAECALDLQGACARGTEACVEGRLQCQQTVRPVAEVCNGVDDDCDGAIDVGPDGQVLSEACYDGPERTQGVGVCRAGARVCANGELGACQGQVVPTEEICDSLDNDCDGEVDDLAGGGRCACQPGAVRECYTGPEGTRGVGACVAGRQQCAADGRSYGPCQGEVLPAPEVCDGVDNDCSGRADDVVPGVGAACTAGVGACLARGLTYCDGAAGEVRCGALPGEPRAEVCNGLDDDCDGTVDDGLRLNEVCAVGVGACQRQGRTVCDGQGGVTCGAQAGAPANEVCNGVDDDCDGVVDDGLGLGDACSVGVGACQRQGQRVCGAQGQVVCGAVAGNPVAEACDGIDNNCDGSVDEGNPGGGQQCDTGSPGECARGVRMCERGRFTCQQQVQPAAEVCDGRDNDCDGARDETAAGGPLTQACYSGPAGTQNVGLCHGGTQTCQEGRFGACVGEVVPAAELCDQLDNNCNGRADDLPGGQVCACQPNTQRQCYSGPAGTQNIGLCRGGLQTCNAQGTAWGACVGEVLPQGETCDGRDNDCNATVDDAPGSGNQCTAGVGECARGGRLVCNAQTGGLVCSAQPGAPQAEVCDGRDNDCNGTNDDVPRLGEQCASGVGACARNGNLVCDVNRRALVCNAVPGPPVPETCNGADDNCDGTADDGQMPGVGVACTNGVGECLGRGVTVCGGGRVACNAVAGAPRPEICDGRDNDCDGSNDDAPVTDVGEDCVVGVGACARQGVSLCRDGGEVCSATPGQPSAEVCDEVDNDCNGRVDDGLVCRVFESCLDALNNGFRQSGIYRLAPAAGAAPVDVYCDQVTDGGGWTLVGSTRDSTLNDQASAYYPDLRTLAPNGPNAGLWDGLRAVGAATFDMRFACRDTVGPENAPFTVDLSFYETPWYAELTAGSDEQSCFSEGDGRGQDLPQPSRRVNASTSVAAGTFVPEGTPWQGTWIGQATNYLEGEDSCLDSGDFTVDLRDRGMDSNQGDGTDWGEDDTTKKCGRSGLATGQWFVFAREDRVLAGSYAVNEGPLWTTPGLVPYSCQEACALQFGGHAAQYECSTVPGEVNRRAFYSGYADGDYCQGEGLGDDFKLGDVYNCGQFGCAYSAFVTDNCGDESVNYCWRRRAEFDAVEQNLPETVLSGGGFTPCYVAPYSDGATSLATIRAQCDGNVLVMGCRPMPSANNPNPTLTVAAMGHRDEVLRDVGDGQDAMHFHNYVNWYFSEQASWGFAPYGTAVSRTTCDTLNGPNDVGAQRLCWHTGEGSINGGWRCGATTGLNGSGAWQRVVYERSGNLAPTPEPIIQ